MTEAGYTAYRSRFGVAGFFAVSNCTNAVLWICFSPIAQIMQLAFGVSALAVNMLSTVFMIMYLPGSALSLYLMERYGLRTTVLTGCALNVACAWVRFFGSLLQASAPGAGFAIIVIGQLIGALGQPIFTNAPTRIAGDWFPVKERDFSTIVCAMSNPIGNAIGAAVPSFVVNGPGDIKWLLLGQAVVATLGYAGSWMYVKDHPPTPPSAAAEGRLLKHAELAQAVQAADLEASRTGSSSSSPASAHLAKEAFQRLAADLKGIMKNKNVWFLLAGFALGLGLFNALLTVLSQYVATCGYGNDTAGYAGGALLGAGLAGAVVAGYIMERTRAYVPLLRVGIVGALACALLMLSSMVPDQPGRLVASFGLLGFWLIPLLPLALENAAEVTYPVPEDQSACLLLIGGQYVGLILTLGMTPLLPAASTSSVVTPTASCDSIASPMAGIILACFLAAGALILAFKKDYRRQRAEAARKAALDGGAPALDAAHAEALLLVSHGGGAGTEGSGVEKAPLLASDSLGS